MSLIEIIKADYQRFPLDQTYSIYAPDIYFQDPLNKFNGIKKYQEMIGFLSKWFRHLRLELHEIQQIENNSSDDCANNSLNNSQDKIITRWTLS